MMMIDNSAVDDSSKCGGGEYNDHVVVGHGGHRGGLEGGKVFVWPLSRGNARLNLLIDRHQTPALACKLFATLYKSYNITFKEGIFFV